MPKPPLRLIPGNKSSQRLSRIFFKLDPLKALFTTLLGAIVSEQPDLRAKMLFILESVRNAPDLPTGEHTIYDEAIRVIREMTAEEQTCVGSSDPIYNRPAYKQR
jgi:hypothetical protein